MPLFIFISVVSITLSLLFYIVVFLMNRKTHLFNSKQLVVLLLGVMFDLIGTAMMMALSTELKFDFHTISGYLALFLMLVMASIGSYAVIKEKQILLINFGKYFLPVLIIWIVSYATGVIVGLQKIS